MIDALTLLLCQILPKNAPASPWLATPRQACLHSGLSRRRYSYGGHESSPDKSSRQARHGTEVDKFMNM